MTVSDYIVAFVSLSIAIYIYWVLLSKDDE
jgi:hypothetical protein